MGGFINNMGRSNCISAGPVLNGLALSTFSRMMMFYPWLMRASVMLQRLVQ